MVDVAAGLLGDCNLRTKCLDGLATDAGNVVRQAVLSNLKTAGSLVLQPFFMQCTSTVFIAKQVYGAA